MRWIFLLMIFCSSLNSAIAEEFFHYQLESVHTFEGRVVSVQTYNFVNRPSPHVQLILQTETGKYVVELGPEWYVKSQGFTFGPMDQISVIGSLITVDGEEYIIAQSIQKNDLVLNLRDQKGHPLWNRWRRD